ncbi:DUF2561 family protein [Mycobacterium kansasii]
MATYLMAVGHDGASWVSYGADREPRRPRRQLAPAGHRDRRRR